MKKNKLPTVEKNDKRNHVINEYFGKIKFQNINS